MREVPSGVRAAADPSSPYTIAVVGTRGNDLFTKRVDIYGVGTSAWYPANAARVELRSGPAVLHSVDPLSETLRSLVRGVHVRGWKTDEQQRKEMLLAEVDEFERTLTKVHDVRATLSKLQSIRGMTTEWITDYDKVIVTNGERKYVGGVSRSEILAQIGRVAARVEARIDPGDYETLLVRPKSSPDPTMLLLAVEFTRDGRVTPTDFNEIPAGKPFAETPGQYTLDLLDDAGNVVEGLSFGLDLTKIRHGSSPSLVDIDSGFKVFAVPYPAETVKVRITKSGTTLVQFDPLGRSLRYAIERIPPRAFAKKDADSKSDDDSKGGDDRSSSDDNERESGVHGQKSLLAKVATIEKLLAQGKRRPARRKLLDLRRSVDRFVGPFDYRHEGETTKAKALQTIDQNLARLDALTSE